MSGAAQIADIPFGRGLPSSLPGQDPTASGVEQIGDISSGGQQDFHLGQGSTTSSAGAADDAFTCFFRTFHRVKKSATLPPRSWPELPPHSSPWTPAAYAVPMVLEEEEEEEVTAQAHVPDSLEWVQLYYWNRRTNATVWKPPPDVKVVSAHRALEEGSTTDTRSLVPVCLTSLLCYLGEAHRGEGLGISSPLLGCHF